MAKMSDLLISGSSDKEMNKMIDNARGIDSAGYISFLEDQLKIRDKALKDLKSNLRKMKIILKKNQ